MFFPDLKKKVFMFYFFLLSWQHLLSSDGNLRIQWFYEIEKKVVFFDVSDVYTVFTLK